MQNVPVSSQPTMHWVRVVDARGRAHLEARWECPAAASVPASAPVTAPAAPLISHAA